MLQIESGYALHAVELICINITLTHCVYFSKCNLIYGYGLFNMCVAAMSSISTDVMNVVEQQMQVTRLD